MTPAILVVDDYAANRDIVVSLVRELGHRALEAADGAEALEVVRAEHPALVISDILMPTMDGFELVRGLRADPALAATEVIFYTAHYREREARNLARACGVRRVIVKPAEPQEIVAAIAEALDRTPAVPAPAPDANFDRDHLRVMTDELSQKVAELESANARLSALMEINAMLASEGDPRALVGTLCRQARELLAARYAFVKVRRKDDGAEAYFSACGIDHETLALLPRPGVDAGGLGELLQTGKARRWVGVEAGNIGLPDGYPSARSALAAPIASLNATYGWICLLDKVGMEGFDEADERILVELGAKVGRIYESGILYSELAAHAEQLRESELRFRQLAENIKEVFFLTTADHLEVLYISPAYDELWGRSRESVYARPSSWMDLVHPEDRARVIAETRLEGYEYDYRIIRDDGTERWIHARGFPIKNAQGKTYRMAGIAEDVTERMRLERDLRGSGSALQRAQSMARLAHLITTEDGSFERWSDSLAQLVGRDEASMPKTVRAWLEIVDPIDRERFRDAAVRAARSNLREELDYRVRRGDGEWIHVRHAMEPLETPPGAPRQWFSTLQDISSVRDVADALRESERRFQDVLANVQLISLILDPEGRIADCNDYLLELTGWRREELLGQPFLVLIPEPMHAELRRVFAAIMANAPTAWHNENEIVTRAGELRFIRWSNSVLRSQSGEVTGTASIGEDVTERRRAEEEVRRLNADLELRVAERTAELEAANKELAAFDYSISHDLRGPLNRIDGFVAALREDYPTVLDARAHGYLDRIVASTDRMNRLVHDLLSLSTVTRHELRRSDVDISEQANAIVQVLQRAEPAREVEVRIAPGLAAKADPGLLGIVLENLLGNAWKFTSRTAHARIEVGMTPGKDSPIFCVRDNGAGFDNADAARLFAPFRRMHRAEEFSGTGIGLATVQRIVRRHGGHIWAKGERGAGATFWFTLAPGPRTPEASP